MSKQFDNTSTRRQFLQKSSATAVIAATAGTAAVSGNAADAVEWRNRQSDMAYRRLGRTGLMVSEIVCGGSGTTDNGIAHIELGIEMGLNYLDTAASYGRGKGEKAFSQLINTSSRRERVFINTKISYYDDNRREKGREVYDGLTVSEQDAIDKVVEGSIKDSNVLNEEYTLPYFGRDRYPEQIRDGYRADEVFRRYPKALVRDFNAVEHMLSSIDNSLKNLGTDYVDIAMCPHGAASRKEMAAPELREGMEKLKKAGKIRFCGVSAHADPAGMVQNAAELGFYDMCMPAFNFVNGKYFTEAFKAARKADLGLIAMKVARPVHSTDERRPAPRPDTASALHKAVPGDMSTPMKAYLWVLQHEEISACNSDLYIEQHVRDNLSIVGKKVKIQKS
jgi:predicted aldo/keto reductase-like oxidoreductase